ncbi:flavodoxin [bacterium BMS3Bbin14]|nr:flavodoxin [bacterium BMS3Abin13]GBE51815.1 flavodoxin [bacterium BMS3Bbin14]HDK43573.1 flavodoxin family protein [Desulfobacteraceae bacterium]HDL97987.1 flavodoxin family protein [Desulfobacteraceae bacterium]HDO30769.1 flavodoxin family protein [Desulfobacteraceae bacterium]
MKQLVVYSSRSGNTKKLAEFIFSRLDGDKEIKSVDKAPDPAGYDMVAVGFWFKAGQPDPDSQKYLKKCAAAGGKLFLFATHGSAANSDYAAIGMNRARELAAGAQIVGCFDCPGEVSAKTLENAANKDPQPVWLKDAPAAKGHPNSDDFYKLAEALAEAGLVEKRQPPEKGMFV